MANNERYIVTRSNYTIKQKHQGTNKGDIYVRDYMTTTQVNSWGSDVFSYGESNFKMVRRSSPNTVRKHGFGSWLSRDNNGIKTDVWTLEGLVSGATSENNISLNPNKGTLLDFACFGSSVELVKASINDIVFKYPAELYVSEDKVYFYDKNDDYIYDMGYNIGEILTELGFTNLSRFVDPESFVEVKNPMGIDISKKYIRINEENSHIVNPMRYFCQSAKKYDILESENGTMVGCCCDWEVLYKARACKSGQLISIVKINDKFTYGNPPTEQFFLFEFYDGEKTYILCDKSYVGLRMRPRKCYIDEFYDNLDAFESVLLDNKSLPLFSCNLDTISEGSQGVINSKERVSWPTVYNWNLDVESNGFNEYVESLLNIAEAYDESETNNIWNYMVHDPIKNLDSTYERPNSDDTTDDYAIGTARMEAVVKVFGRLMDDIKRYADGIRSVTKVTYDKYNNIPDSQITDSLELSGWDVFNPVNGLLQNSEIYSLRTNGTDPIYSGKFNTQEAGVEFMRNLKINSKFIFSHKGTKRGIESLLAMFGMASLDFVRNMYNQMPQNEKNIFAAQYGTTDVTKDSFTIAPSDFDSFFTYNGYDVYSMFDYTMDEYVAVASGGEMVGEDEVLKTEEMNALKTNYIGGDDTLEGLMCAKVQSPNGSQYIVPWFNKASVYDGNPYFQMFGGWCKMNNKDVTNDGTDIITIYPSSGGTITKKVTTVYTIDNMTEGYFKTTTPTKSFEYDMVFDDNYRSLLIPTFKYGDSVNISNVSQDSSAVTIIEVSQNEEETYTVSYLKDKKTNSKANSVDKTIIIQTSGFTENTKIYFEHEIEEIISGFDIYDEDETRLGVVGDVYDLVKVPYNTIQSGDIYYVNDLSNYEEAYGEELKDIPSVAQSHYFVLKDKELYDTLGDNGWVNIPQTDIDAKYNELNYGAKVRYIESLVDNSKGNAPHTGKGKYDDGEMYLNYYRNVFFDAINNNGFSEDAYECETGLLEGDITSLGFDIETQKDNTKCWFFSDTTETPNIKQFNARLYRHLVSTTVVRNQKGAKLYIDYNYLYVCQKNSLKPILLTINKYNQHEYEQFDEDVKEYVKNLNFNSFKRAYKSFYSKATELGVVKIPDPTIYNNIDNKLLGEYVQVTANTQFAVVGETSENKFRYNNLMPHNFENGAINDEAAANSIINIKKFKITFNNKSSDGDGQIYKTFLIESVLPYLKQMIPSTTIFELSLPDAMYKNGETPTPNAMAEDGTILTTRYGTN